MVALDDRAAGADVRRSFAAWRNRLIASPGFQRWAAAFPPTRGLVRREGAALFDLVAGFCRSQVLAALVELNVLDVLIDGPADPDTLARRCDVRTERMRVLLRAGAALRLLRYDRRGRVRLTRSGAALLGVPGLTDMIRHHRSFYADLADPTAFFREDTPTALAAFWPYVHGSAATTDREAAERYSDLMARSQAMVAEDTLRVAPLKAATCLMDVGGGTGAFLAAAGRRYPSLRLHLFDLPDVAPDAAHRFAAEGLTDRSEIVAGSFRDDPLPRGSDAISLVRVLYDHSEATVRALLTSARVALPPGGRLVISEPMSGGDAKPDPVTDVYFALYTMAMGTGRTRSADEIAALCRDAGFIDIRRHPSARSYVTTVISARTPATSNVHQS